MHCDVICTHSNTNNITHCDFTMAIPKNVISHCNVIMSDHCDVAEHILVYHIKTGHSME